jgi:hypothetical protein
MPIPMSKYVQITSGVGGGSSNAVRQLVGCIFTPSSLVDPLVPLTFEDVADIGNYFGTASEEYLRAVLYFGYISPTIRQPQSLSFARLVRSASPASIFGAKGTYSSAGLAAVIAGMIAFNFGDTPTVATAGAFVVGTQYTITSVGTTNFVSIGASASTVGIVFIATGVGAGTGTATSTGNVCVTGVNLSANSSLSNAAANLQTAFRLSVDARLTTCSVSYDAVNSRFDFVASSTPVTTSAFSISQIGSGVTDLAAELGWYASAGALVISSSLVTTPVQAFTNTIAISNNFGSLCFTNSAALTLSEQMAVSSYNNTLNVSFLYHINVKPESYAAASAALLSFSGTGLTYELDTLTQFPEMIPMAIEAATDYTQRNGVVNYMYRQIPGITPSVTDSPSNPTLSTTLDAARVNYYGQTQNSGQLLSFYQNGVLCGLSTEPQAMNVYANEQWFKSYITSNILNLQLALPQISANKQGIGQITAVLQDAITTALFNGTISVGKALTTIQQLYITTQTGDNNAWLQVANIGYWFTVNITSAVDPNSGLTIYSANYTIIYAKNDAVQKVVGTHVLI